jgi:hypothetical protein
MKQKIIISILITSMSLVYSCSKEEKIEPELPTTPAITYPKFSQLKTGNYWVYEQFDVDTLGNAISKNVYDSCYVEKDTIINNITYYKMLRPKAYSSNQYNISFQRDSLDYIVDINGTILFSSQNFSTVFFSRYNLWNNDTTSYVTTKMTDKDFSFSTPAGIFTTSNLQHKFLMYPNYSFAGNIRTINTRYAENIGIVIETHPFFLSHPDYIERRLIRYNVNN